MCDSSFAREEQYGLRKRRPLQHRVHSKTFVVVTSLPQEVHLTPGPAKSTFVDPLSRDRRLECTDAPEAIEK